MRRMGDQTQLLDLLDVVRSKIGSLWRRNQVESQGRSFPSFPQVEGPRDGKPQGLRHIEADMETGEGYMPGFV